VRVSFASIVLTGVLRFWAMQIEAE